MPQYNRIIAAYTAFAIMGVVILFGLGHYTATLEQFFSFSALSLFVQFILAVALLIILFFGRPRSRFHRTYFGAVATIAIFFGAHGAFTGSLLLGDALITLVGSIVTVMEAIEDGVAAKVAQPPRSLPAKTQARSQ